MSGSKLVDSFTQLSLTLEKLKMEHYLGRLALGLDSSRVSADGVRMFEQISKLLITCS